MIDKIEARIKYLEELVGLSKLDKSFSAQSRLDEAKYIHQMLTNPDKSTFTAYLELNKIV